jgi:hypothetical protein
MNKLFVITLLFVFSFSNLAKADEGMWLPILLGRNYEDMKKMGLNLTQEEIYSINQSSLKDAIVSFGGFCTAEVISKKGLLLTNHHCGYEAIAGASSEEDNYLDDGFWAKSHDMEIPIEGLTATFIIRMEDVTEQIARNLSDDMTSEERNQIIEKIKKDLVKEATESTSYDAYVRSFYEGNEFYMFVTETFNDVRLTGNPPEAIGKFGHDTDNWMYPRHTGDFALFRVYANKNNAPAAYSEENVPYKPKHALPISLKGIKEGDFTMVFGFPGSTDRYLSSFGVEQAIQLEQPKRVDIRAKKLEIMKRYMDESTKDRLNYASTYAQVANYWKYFIGQTEQLKNNKVADKKREIESKFSTHFESNEKYSGLLDDLQDAYTFKDDYVFSNAYMSEFIYTVPLNRNVYTYAYIDQLNEDGDAMRASMIQQFFGKTVITFFEESNLDLEFEMLTEVLKMYYNDLPKKQQPKMIYKLGKKGKIDAHIKMIREESVFADKERFTAFTEDFSFDKLHDDPLFQLVKSIAEKNEDITSGKKYQENEEKLNRARRLFIKGYREMEPGKLFYPNANSTLRLTYGQVLPYKTQDGMKMEIETYLSGVIKKEDPNNSEFHVPQKLKDLYEAKDFGEYGNPDGTLSVNFISNNDITGGNSGSPVINADGHLIGTAFDGNWEAMSGDIFFEDDLQRTISCDIRYVLFIIDKYGGASNLIEEMEIIR